MRSELTRYGCVSIILLLFPLSRQDTKTDGQTRAEVQIIQMTAKRYEFAPSQLHVKAGTKVELKITALDREHGFQIAALPEGAKSDAQPGLLFSLPPR